MSNAADGGGAGARPCVLVWHDHAPTYREVLQRSGLLDRVEFVGVPASATPPAGAFERAEVLLAASVPPDALRDFVRLAWVQAITVGVDDWFARDDLAPETVICCARGVHRVQMPENILGAIFHATKPFATAARRQAEGRWDATLVSQPIAGSTLGIIGLGTIGGELARKAAGLEMRVLGVARTARDVAHVERVYLMDEIDAMLAKCDFVVTIVPATPETDNLIDARRFAAMKSSAWFLNFARGNVVVDADLVEAVSSRRIAGAVLDDYRTEPLPAGHPFWTTPGILMLPHMGGKHPHRNAIVAEVFAGNLRAWLERAPLPTAVDRARGY